MGRIFLVELEGRIYRCQYCRSHLALADDLVSRRIASAEHLEFDWHVKCLNPPPENSLAFRIQLCDYFNKHFKQMPVRKPSPLKATLEYYLEIKEGFYINMSYGVNIWAFHCRRGKAYLFNNVVNISVGAQEERMMLSGMHTVADIFCCCCGQIVGWKYEAAHDKSQKYKEGKFVLERGRIVDGIDSEFFLDNRPSGSDAED